MMNFSKSLMDSMQESIQVWDTQGNKLFCNNKASPLYELHDTQMRTIDDVLSSWTFYDERDKVLRIEELPAYKVMHTKESVCNVTLKMVSKQSTKWITTSVNPIFGIHGEMEAIATTCLDITDLKSQETKYRNIANYDPLTKLPNRLLLSDRLLLAVSHADRHQNSIAVCMIDLDGFKAVNDTLGHDAGDILLVEVAQRMQKIVRSDDTVARLGGDEFVIILNDIQKSDECAVMLYRLLNAISSPYMINETEVTTVSASIGVCLYPDDKVESDILLRHADIAMYKAKNSGKNRFCFFDIASDQKIKANFKTLSKLKKAISLGEFCFYYQPKINTATGKIVEVEALARWIHPFLGVLSSDEFLPLIENDDELNNEFDSWAIREGILQLQAWQKEGIFVKICVNISPKQFKQKNFISKIKAIIADENIDEELLGYLEFEILETAAVEHLNNSNEVIKECKALGISFALDDFGTGHSSLVHLKELAIDTIKIDKSFVMGMLDGSENMAIVQAVTGLANAFDITVTAEGAENIEQILSLIEIGCDEIQGFGIARPMPKEDMKDFISCFVADPRWKLASQTLPSKADFELLLAEVNHKYWIELIISELSKENPNDKLFHSTHVECKFGQWFEKIKSKHIIMNQSFKDLDNIHRKAHEDISALYAKLKKEKRVLNEQEKQEIFETSSALVVLLNKMRQEYASQKKHKSLVQKIINKREQYGK